MTAFFGFPRDGHAYSADEVGAALAGLIRRDSNGLPVPGVLGTLSVAAVPTSWKVEVAPFTYVRRAGSGIQLTGLSAAEQVDIVPATGIPAGQGRIDVVAWDASSDVIVVVPGTVSASPAVPNTAGYEPLVRVRVNSGDGAVIAGQLTPVFAQTGLAGSGQAVGGTIAKRSVVAGGSTEVSVTFPVGMFTEPPNVQVTTWGIIRDVNAGLVSKTKDGCVISLGSNSVSARTFGAEWRAEQF